MSDYIDLVDRIDLLEKWIGDLADIILSNAISEKDLKTANYYLSQLTRETGNSEFVKILSGNALPDNPRYLLWMLYAGKYEIPDNQMDYIIWIKNKASEYRQMIDDFKELYPNENWDRYKNFEEWLIYDVRKHLVENCTISKHF